MVDSESQNIKVVKFPKKYEASYVIDDNLDRIIYYLEPKTLEVITNKTSLKTIFTNEPINSPFFYQMKEFSNYESSKIFSVIISHPNLPCQIE